MEEQNTEQVKRRKSSSCTFAHTGADYAVKSKTNPTGLHPAAVAWLDVLKAAGKPLTKDECIDALSKVQTGTTQGPIRIIYACKKLLVAGGWLIVTKPQAPVKKRIAVVAAAPAPAEPVPVEQVAAPAESAPAV